MLESKGSRLSIFGWVVFLFVAAWRLAWIYQHPYPIATDSFYYLEEFRSYLSGGTGYYTDRELFFQICAAIGKLFAINPEQIYNLLVISSLTLVSAALVLVIRSSQRIWIAPLIVAALWSSDLLFYRHYAFPQQAFAVGCVLLGIAVIVNGFSSRVALVAGLSLAVLGASFHLFAACLALLILIALLTSQISRVLLVTLLLVLCGAAAIAFATLDSGAFQSWHGAWPPGIVRACTFARCSTAEWSEVFVLSAVVLSAALVGWRAGVRDARYWSLWSIPLMLNLLPWNDQNHLSYRLALATPWCIFWIAAYGLRFQIALPIYLLVIGAAIGGVLGRGEYPGPTLDPRELASNREALQRWIPQDAVVVAPHGIQYRVRYEIERSSQHRMPSSVPTNKVFIVYQQRRATSRCPNIGPQIEPRTKCVALSNRWVIERSR